MSYPARAEGLVNSTNPQLHPCHRLFDQDGPDLAPCDFWLFPKLRGYRYETIEEVKEAMTKVIDMLTQEDFHGALEFHVCTINKSAHTKIVWKLI